MREVRRAENRPSRQLCLMIEIAWPPGEDRRRDALRSASEQAKTQPEYTQRFALLPIREIEYLVLKMAFCFFTHPFLSFLESHRPHVGGVPVLNRVKAQQKQRNFKHHEEKLFFAQCESVPGPAECLR